MLSIIWRVWKLDLFPMSGVEVMRDSYLFGPLEGDTHWRKHAEFPKYCVQRYLRLWTLFKIQVMFIGIYCCQKCLYLGMTTFYSADLCCCDQQSGTFHCHCLCMHVGICVCMHAYFVCVCAHACEWVCMCEWQIFIHIEGDILKYCHFSQICLE